MSYEVIKTVNGHQYRYLQESYREGGKVRTRSTYLGPVKPKRRIIDKLVEALRDHVKSKQPWHVTPEQHQAFLEQLAADMEQRHHINAVLTGATITLEQLQEVIEHQAPGHREDTPDEAARALAEVEAVPEFAPEASEGMRPETVAEAEELENDVSADADQAGEEKGPSADG